LSARLFAALDLPAGVRDQLAAFGRAAAAGDPLLRPVQTDDLHVTLAFLGHRPLDELAPAADAVRACAPAWAPPLALGAPLWLSPRRPHVLTVALEDPAGELEALQGRLVASLRDAVGFEPERRRFLPHVTVARVRRGAAPRTADLPPAPRAAFAGEALTLYRSYLGGRPVRYEVVARAGLRPAAQWPRP
jgi:2'-5' RNA ligase